MTRVRLDHAHARALLRGMIRIRRFEEKCYELYTREKISGFLHLHDGEEAVAVGVAAALTPQDRMVSTYREHGHALARGLDLTAALAEMFGKATGCSGGRGGSMHLFDAATNLYGGNAIVGGGLPLAVGLALGDRMQGQGRVTTCFFGEGAVAEGEFHESMNLAALWHLPVLFVLENNLYAMGSAVARVQANTDFVPRAASYGMPAESVDGNDVVAVDAAARRLAEEARAGHGPRFLECRTYRTRAHSMFDAEKYRNKTEVAEWRQHSPIVRFQSWPLDNGLMHQAEVDAIEAEVEADLAQAVAACEQAPWEPVETLNRHVVAETRPAPPEPPPHDSPVDSTYRDCCRAAIADALRRDERVFMMGEDIGAYGGCYAVSLGLLQDFGPDRIRDTPLSEAGFTGAGIGAALAGLRPIVEIQPGRLPCPYPRPAGDGPRHAGRRPRHAVDGAAGPRPGDHPGTCHALQPGGADRGQCGAGRHRPRRDPPPGPGCDADRLVACAVDGAGGRRNPGPPGDRGRGDRPAQPAPAG